LPSRFGLAFHQEKSELSAYTITVAKGGEPQHGVVVRIAEVTTFLLLPLMDQPVVDQTGFAETHKTKAQVHVMVIDNVSRPSAN
jgi:Protein of unknown function (DUF3738)